MEKSQSSQNDYKDLLVFIPSFLGSNPHQLHPSFLPGSKVSSEWCWKALSPTASRLCPFI